ncbi:MAG: hypothetical protein ACE5JR_13185 [Gemmatimonadota bacterium]
MNTQANNVSGEGRGSALKEVALVYGALRDLDRAFEYLDRAYETERASLYYLNADPSADPLRADPRWAPFLEGLE